MKLNWTTNKHNGEHILLDGGFAIELSKQGIDLNHVLWTAKALLDSPEAVRKAHAAYLKSGAMIISTSSYQATPQRFHELGLDDDQIKQIFERIYAASFCSMGRNATVQG